MQKVRSARAGESVIRPVLKGKSAVVTRSTSGIGLGIVQAFANAGMDVMLNGFGDTAEIEGRRNAIERDYGVRAAFSGADMSKPDEIVTKIREAKLAFGKVDVLVNNAGIQHVEPVETFPIDKWDAIIAIDLSAAFHATNEAASITGAALPIEGGWTAQ